MCVKNKEMKCSKAGNGVNCNLQVRSCNHCCSGKAISITYCECVFVALGIQHAMHTRHIATSDLPRSTTFLHIIS